MFLLIWSTLFLSGCRGASVTQTRAADILCYQQNFFSATLRLQTEEETTVCYQLTCDQDGHVYQVIEPELLSGVHYVFPLSGGTPVVQYEDFSANAVFLFGSGTDAATIDAVLFETDPADLTRRDAKDTVRLSNPDGSLIVEYHQTADRVDGQITPLLFQYRTNDGNEIVLTMTAYRLAE